MGDGAILSVMMPAFNEEPDRVCELTEDLVRLFSTH